MNSVTIEKNWELSLRGKNYKLPRKKASREDTGQKKEKREEKKKQKWT